jgi:hypothetical protein
VVVTDQNNPTAAFYYQSMDKTPCSFALVAVMQNSWDFSVYDPNCPQVSPDISTPFRLAAVQFEDAVRHDFNENGAFFRPDGSLIFRKIGTPSNVLFSASELIGVNNSGFSHNHPGGHSFSMQDVRHAVELDLIELRAVAPHWRYIMHPAEAWPGWDAIEQSVKDETPFAIDEINPMLKANQLRHQHLQIELHHHL